MQFINESFAILQTHVSENYHDAKNIGMKFSFTNGYWKVLLARE